jgi:hypothetical protein
MLNGYASLVHGVPKTKLEKIRHILADQVAILLNTVENALRPRHAVEIGHDGLHPRGFSLGECVKKIWRLV